MWDGDPGAGTGPEACGIHEAVHIIAGLVPRYRFTLVTTRSVEQRGYEGILYGSARDRVRNPATVPGAGTVVPAKMAGSDPRVASIQELP